MAQCAAAQAAVGPVTSGQDRREYLLLRSAASEIARSHRQLHKLEAAELCSRQWILYLGDENYGLGNVLYDVVSASALAFALNRSLAYGATRRERKFGSLLSWEALPSLDEVDALWRRHKCGRPVSSLPRTLFAPDRCTFQKTWRKPRSAGRCLKRLLGTDWLNLRAPVLELTKVRLPLASGAAHACYIRTVCGSVRAAHYLAAPSHTSSENRGSARFIHIRRPVFVSEFGHTPMIPPMFVRCMPSPRCSSCSSLPASHSDYASRPLLAGA
jgi:hypothetical protein